MEKIFNQFYHRLPVRPSGADEHLHLLSRAESRQIRRRERMVTALAALLSVAGFLSYYLPVYYLGHFFPPLTVPIQAAGKTLSLPWAEILWGVLLTVIELYLLTLLGIYGVHEIAVATGFLTDRNKHQRCDDLLAIGMGKKTREASRYGIDPFQGLNKLILFFFNTLLRLKGWLANLVVRYLLRWLVGRYAVRALLDFSGMPIYMAINAYSVHVLMREARVNFMGRKIIGLLGTRLPQRNVSAEEKELIYDTLQYIAVSKRDFHQNHYLLTKQLLEFFQIASQKYHPVPDDYLEKLRKAGPEIGDLCRLVILLGFILDGQLSWRERLKLRALNRAGILRESYADLRRYARDFLNGAGVETWSTQYLSGRG